MEMKKHRSLAAILAVVASLALILAGCSSSSNKSSNNNSNKASMQNETQDKSAKQLLTSSDNLWYMNGSINYNSKSGIDAYKFN